MQHPIVADNLYASKKPKLLGFERFALHARTLEFRDMDGFTQKIEAEYPEDFKKALKLVHTQLSDNKSSLYHDYEMQTEHFDEFTNCIIGNI
jgi:hypothetical protein